MNFNYIKNKIRNYSVKAEGVENYYSVLLPLVKVEEGLHLLYEIRSHNLNTQPGEISFPGGKVEDDENYASAALRETSEELNISEDHIDLMGELDYIITPYNIIIRVFAGFISIDPEEISPNPDEVKSIFTVPLKFFKENKPDEYYLTFRPHENEKFPYHMIKNGKDYEWREGKYPVYFYEYKSHIIWGFTARMTRNFMQIAGIY